MRRRAAGLKQAEFTNHLQCRCLCVLEDSVCHLIEREMDRILMRNRQLNRAGGARRDQILRHDLIKELSKNNLIKI